MNFWEVGLVLALTAVSWMAVGIMAHGIWILVAFGWGMIA